MKNNKNKNIDVTICCFTFNSEETIEEYLEAVFSQRTDLKYEVLVIDSGSTDNTLEILKKYDLRLKKIPNSDFGHGKTRNLAVKLVRGKIVVMTVDDMIPVNDQWLNELIKPFSDPEIVATYGKHVPKKGAAPFIERDIKEFFQSLVKTNKLLIQRIRSKKKYSDFEWGRLIYFSDVNSAIRKSYVKKYPYEEVEYAEDQLMGETIIKNGYRKSYNPKAAAYHSHTYPIKDYLFRYFDEYLGLKETLGYTIKVDAYSIIIDLIKGWLLDAKYIWKKPSYSLLKKLMWIIKAFFYNFFRRLAGILAAKEEELPNFLKNRLSLEARRRRKVLKRKTEENNLFDYTLNKCQKAKYIYNEYGLRGLKKYIVSGIRKKLGLNWELCFKKEDKTKFYFNFVEEVNTLSLPSLKKPKMVKSKKIINWIIPDFGIGSGGHMTIFRIIQHLESRGYENNIYMFGKTRYKHAGIIKDTIGKYFLPLKAEVFVGWKYMKDSSAVFATSWPTAYALAKTINTRKRLYLVQDFEPSFYPMSSDYIFAENTYKMGFHCICASKWLAETLNSKYNAKTDFFNLGFDENYYYPSRKSKRNKKKSIVFYGRWVTPRRAFELGVLALNRIKSRFPNVDIKIFGWQEKRKDIPFQYKNLGILSQKKLGDLFRKSTIGLSLSLSNVSLMPFEMMACGLPVVELENPSITDLFEPNKEILLSKYTPHSIENNIAKLLENESYRKKISKHGQKKVFSSYTWGKAFKAIERVLRDNIEN